MAVAVILAGGKGKRLGLTDIPKPMVEVAGVPLVERQVRFLVSQGIDRIFFLCGHLGEKIFTHFKDGSSFKAQISYLFDPYPLGTAGSLSLLKGLLAEDFFLVYGDVFFNIDTKKMMQFHQKHEAQLTALVHPSTHIEDSDLVCLDQDHRIIKIYNRYEERPQYYHNIGNAAFYIMSPDLLEKIEYGVTNDFFQDTVPAFLKDQVNIMGYLSPELIMDIGTPARKSKLEHYFATHSPILNNHRAAFFLDRDGVINRYVEDIKSIDDIDLLPGVAEAIQKIHQNGYLVVVVTNQPGIAKGFFTEKQLDEMHQKIETLLAHKGAFVDRIYYCPHHPDAGFEGERVDLKISCNCRKPKIGLIHQAVQDLRINLQGSYIVGDSFRDIEAGKLAGIKTTFITGQEDPQTVDPDYIYDSLLDFVEHIFNTDRQS